MLCLQGYLPRDALAAGDGARDGRALSDARPAHIPLLVGSARLVDVLRPQVENQAGEIPLSLPLALPSIGHLFRAIIVSALINHP